MMIKKIDDAKKIFSDEDLFVLGIGVRAYPRIAPMYLMDRDTFNILHYSKSNDDYLISEKTDLVSFREVSDNACVKRIDTTNMLENEKFQEFLNKKANGRQVCLYVYKNNKKIEEIAAKNKWKVLYPDSQLGKKYENKEYFRNLLKKLDIEAIPNENLAYEQFMCRNYSDFRKTYGEKIVLQIANYIGGGGLGTIFINNQEEFVSFQDEIKDGVYKGNIDVEVVNVASYLDALAISMNGCVTKHGILRSSARTMIIDIADVRKLGLGNGLFCGHDWAYQKFDKQIMKQMNSIIDKVGGFISKDGYRGIFGIDFLLDERTNKVYPIECNPRYTGNFPVESLPLLQNDKLSLDVFHILEMMGIDYEIENIESLNEVLQYSANLSHIFLTNIQDKEFTVNIDLKAGIYEMKNDDLELKKKSLRINDIGENEFMIVENVSKGERIAASTDPSRFMRLIFNKRILSDKNNLTNEAKAIIKNIYKEFYE